MKLEPDYVLGEEIRRLAQSGKTPAQILRWLVTQGLSPVELMIQFAAAFGLPTSAAACINGWWPDNTGELADEEINQRLTGEITLQQKDLAA